MNKYIKCGTSRQWNIFRAIKFIKPWKVMEDPEMHVTSKKKKKKWSEKSTLCVIPIIWHSRKDKAIETGNVSGYQDSGKGVEE